MSVGQSATGTKAVAVILRPCLTHQAWVKYWIRTVPNGAPCRILMSILLLNCVSFTSKIFSAS